MQKTLSLFTITLLCCGLSIFGNQKLNPKELEYLKKAMEAELQFKPPATDGKKVWNRIETFIQKFSFMKIKISDEMVVETLTPTKGIMRYGYRGTKKTSTEDIIIAIACSFGNDFQGNKL